MQMVVLTPQPEDRRLAGLTCYRCSREADMVLRHCQRAMLHGTMHGGLKVCTQSPHSQQTMLWLRMEQSGFWSNGLARAMAPHPQQVGIARQPPLQALS
jgi:hypothetical protein